MTSSRQTAFLFTDDADAPAETSRASVNAVERVAASERAAGIERNAGERGPGAAARSGGREPGRPEPGRLAHVSHGRAVRLAAALERRLGAPVRLVVTDNRTAMFSARKRPGHIDVRANHVFLEASESIVDAMAAAVHRDPAARERLRLFLRERRKAIRPTVKRERRASMRTRGAHHDLSSIFARLESAYFPDAMTGVRITWGPALGRRRRRRRSIQLGLYIPEDRLIRIHRALDQEWVPRFYVESVVFHEMLHHCMPPARRGRQIIFHTPQFRALEKVFPHHAEAEVWEKVHLDRLLSS
ncbi:MAG: hypothetical protein CMN30_20750 [Sandaracinus sp.]|nr:hypothetical protein [Sandaracinus sp.]